MISRSSQPGSAIPSAGASSTRMSGCTTRHARPHPHPHPHLHARTHTLFLLCVCFPRYMALCPPPPPPLPSLSRSLSLSRALSLSFSLTPPPPLPHHVFCLFFPSVLSLSLVRVPTFLLPYLSRILSLSHPRPLFASVFPSLSLCLSHFLTINTQFSHLALFVATSHTIPISLPMPPEPAPSPSLCLNQ